MENLKSLADQLREEIAKPAGQGKERKDPASAPKSRTPKSRAKLPEIVEAIKAFDNKENKTLVHVRFDARTVNLMNRFKLAAGVDLTKLVAFAVHTLFESYPELKQTINHYLKDLEL